MAASPHLFRALQPLLADGPRTGPLFPDSNDLTVPVRSYRNPTKYLTEGWDRAIEDGHARATVVRPPGRKKAAPNHAFRSALQQWLEEEGVRGRVIDWLVGHAPPDTRGRHYVRPSMASQQKAVALIPEITWEDMLSQPTLRPRSRPSLNHRWRPWDPPLNAVPLGHGGTLPPTTSQLLPTICSSTTSTL